MPGSFAVDIAGHESHPIVDMLGLRSTRRTPQQAELRSLFQLSLSFSAHVERGEVVHDAMARKPARSARLAEGAE
jgi:hypothetical protein